jgi:hypothetical protein
VDISDQESAGRQRRMCIFYVVYAWTAQSTG